MKKVKKFFILFVILSTLLISCTKNFDIINTNPNATTIATPNYLFTNCQINTFGDYFETGILSCGGFIQHYATYKEVPAIGDKYFYNDFYTSPFFVNSFPGAVNQITDVINNTTSNLDINKNNIAKIWKVYIFHRLTDLYGDIPYSQAGKGFTSLNYSPVYDSQSAIYDSMLNQLEVSAKALDATKTGFSNADLIYAGNIDKWKKFSYSLMLRLGMRLTKIDIAKAEIWVKKAIAGGVILNSSDLAIIKFTDGPQNYNRNPLVYLPRNRDFIANSFGRTNTEGGKFSKTFIDYLKSNNDPRINIISGVWINKIQDTSLIKQIGFTNGIGTAPSADLLGTYSEPNQNTIFKMDAPLLVIGNAEINLLLAEANLRGWYSEDANICFQRAIKSSFDNYSTLYGTLGTINSTRVNDFVTSKTLTGTTEQKLELIYTEFWVSLFMDEIEIYSNWRRTGYPKLIPVNYPGNASNSTIPRRLIYPNIENASNSKNYQEAIKRQGADLFTTRIWWDKL